MARTATPKPIKHHCSCRRGFTTHSGFANHARGCDIERARSNAMVGPDGVGHGTFEECYAASQAIVQKMLDERDAKQEARDDHMLPKNIVARWRPTRAEMYGR